LDVNTNGRVGFNDFEFEARSGQLLRNGQPVRIQPQPLRVLQFLLERSGHTVSRDELRDHIWGDATYVEFDQGLNYCIRQIRLALGDNAANPVYIETLPKQGYRFLPPVIRSNGNAERYMLSEPADAALDATAPPTSSRFDRDRARWMVAAALCAVLAIATSLLLLYVARKPRRLELAYTALTDFTDSVSAPALSSDGRMLAFLRGSSFLTADQVYIKTLPNGEAKRLTDDPRPKCCVAFSPDGSKVAYTVLTHPRWDTYTVSVLGGDSTLFLKNAAGLTWLDERRLLFSQIRSGLHMGVVTGTLLHEDFRSLYFPAHERGMAHYSFASPDRKSALVIEMDQTGAWAPCRLISLDGEATGRLVGPPGNCTSAGWSPDNAWMFFSAVVKHQSHLWRQHFPRGEPEQITDGPTEEKGIAVDPDGRSVVTSMGTRESAIWIHEPSGDRALSFEGQVEGKSPPRFGPDGKTLFYLMSRDDKGWQRELWRMNTDSGKSEAVLPGISMSSFDISPDNKQVVYTGLGAGGGSSLWVASLDRSAPPRQIGHSGESSPHFGLRGQIIFLIAEGKFNYVEQMNLDGSSLSKVAPYPIGFLQGISPGRHWIMAIASVPGRNEVAPIAIPAQGGPPRVVCAGYCGPIWSPDGRFLFVPVEDATMNNPGRSLAIPAGPEEAIPEFPSGGIAPGSDVHVVTGAQSIARAQLIPGSDLSHFAYIRTSVHQNLYRISIP
jgi:DNA-binding winged helix-turn-helix (wHTH) protein/WD40 repeat protein